MNKMLAGMNQHPKRLIAWRREVDSALRELWNVSPVLFLIENAFFYLQYLSPANWLFYTREEWQRFHAELEDEKQKELTKKRARRIDAYLLTSTATEALLLIIVALQVAWGWLVVMPACLRIVEIVQTGININIFDRLRMSTKSHRVADLARMVILSIWNFVELAFCFAIMYAALPGAIKPSGIGNACYFSVITQLTIGYGDVLPQCGYKAIPVAQGILGFIFGLIVLSRLVAFLPEFNPVFRTGASPDGTTMKGG